jgi:hypothetical protein
MNCFQLADYFMSEGEAWTCVTQEGYVSLLQIDTDYESEKALEAKALKRYKKLQKRWRLCSYQDLVASEGADKARANITLRFYEDALESFKPKSRRDIRALYAWIALIPFLPIAAVFYLSSAPDYGVGLPNVSWLPDYTSDISYYRSKKIEVYEFRVSLENFKSWAKDNGLTVKRIVKAQTLSRYNAYLPVNKEQQATPAADDGFVPLKEFEAWQNAINIQITDGLIAKHPSSSTITAIYEPQSNRVYYENLSLF